MCQKAERFFALGPGGVYAMAAPGTYTYWVRQATRKLRDSFFGLWRGTTETYDNHGNVIFIEDNPSGKDDKYDSEFWEPLDSHTGWGRVLSLNDGKEPADAIDAILNRLSKWRIDCDHTVQIANLYALRMILGAKAFNQRIATVLASPEEIDRQNKDNKYRPYWPATRMQLRPRYSTGLKTIQHYGREDAADDWKVVLEFDPSKRDDQEPFRYGPVFADSSQTSELLGRALAGSRVRFTNPAAGTLQSFRHENAVKLEYDLYAAGGLNDVVNGNEFAQSPLMYELAAHNHFLNIFPPEAEVKQVFIDEIEIFDQS
jgi:Protein-glutamine gamma-glutamyltransferase